MMKLVTAIAALLAIGMIALAVAIALKPDLPPAPCQAWDDPREAACTSVAEIIAGKADILVILHEQGHAGWTLLDGQDTRGRKPVAWPKASALEADPTIRAALTTPCGHRAVRKSRAEPWIIE
jgi:hypothetical protein